MSNITTKERLMRLETKLDDLIKKLEDYIVSNDKQHTDFVKNADRKYAAKWVQNVVAGMCGIILGSVLYLLLDKIGL
jgi:ribosome biogenesis protein Nip4